MNAALLQRIPAGVRDAAYLAILVAGFGLGAIQTAYLAADYDQPQWLIIAFAVYGYLAGAFGLTASQNVDRSPAIPAVEPTDHVDAVTTEGDLSDTLDYETDGDHTALDDEPEYEGRRVAETEDY